MNGKGNFRYGSVRSARFAGVTKVEKVNPNNYTDRVTARRRRREEP
jgi:hypothetical protein